MNHLFFARMTAKLNAVLHIRPVSMGFHRECHAHLIGCYISTSTLFAWNEEEREDIRFISTTRAEQRYQGRETQRNSHWEAPFVSSSPHLLGSCMHHGGRRPKDLRCGRDLRRGSRPREGKPTATSVAGAVVVVRGRLRRRRERDYLRHCEILCYWSSRVTAASVANRSSASPALDAQALLLPDARAPPPPDVRASSASAGRAGSAFTGHASRTHRLHVCRTRAPPLPDTRAPPPPDARAGSASTGRAGSAFTGHASSSSHSDEKDAASTPYSAGSMGVAVTRMMRGREMIGTGETHE